ncbi:hypothetical protein G6F31_021594 [Rhizopus arrhizus]|nr:hypothetical protein G6F31_021594 [Rhizopus arrhizus]
MLVVAGHQRDGLAQHRAPHFFDGQAGGFHRPLAGGVGGDARHVRQDPDLHAVGRAGMRGDGAERQA